MDIDENTNVLDEVETLFKKLESLPDNIKQAALNKIQEKLPVQVKDTSVSDKKTRPGRKRRAPADGCDGSKGNDNICSPENSDTEYVVEDVLTSRGRKAKRISYSNVHGYGRKSESTGEKTKNSFVENDEEKNEIKTDDIDSTSKKDGNKEYDMKSATLTNKEECNDHSTTECEEEIHMEKGHQESLHTTSASNTWRKRKVPRTGNLACQDCYFVTNSKSLLEIHSRRHSGIKPYVCPDCGKAFPQSSGLNIHMKRHRGQRDHPCDYCEYRAYTKVDKLRHMTIHTGERNQICQYCGKAFAKDSTLREHVRSIHERPFKHVCSECGFTTYRANNLRVHVRMRHRGEYNNHVCPVCGAHVKQRNAFLEHMRAHTGEKPFRCDQCDSSFACLARLTVHRKSVHEPRQFPCTQCRKTFQTKHHLLRHSVIHTKSKPFACPFCTYSCNTQGNMTKHVKTIHHMPHFSYRKYKSDQELELSAAKSVNPDWVEKGQRVTEQYLKDLSTKLGRDVTLDELRARETEKQKRINDEAELAKIKRMNRIHTPEHSYHSRFGKMTTINSKVKSVKIEAEEVVDPTTLILQVAAQNADNFVESVNVEGLTSESHIVQVDLLSGMNTEDSPKTDSSQIAVPSHIVQMLSNINNDENSKGSTQVIHIQTSDSLQETEDNNSGNFETVILSGEGEGNDFVGGEVYELISSQNLRLCLNAEFIETGDGNTIQVIHQESLHKTDEVCDDNQESEQHVIQLENAGHFMTNKGGKEETTDTVVVIINTDHSQESDV